MATMATYSWNTGTDGNWSDAANWSPAGVPGSADMAPIEAAGTYDVTLDVDAIGSLTLDAAGATVDLDGYTTLAGLLDVQCGTLDRPGTLSGGTIAYGGGVPDGVTLDGTLDLSADKSAAAFQDGITFAGTAPEQILTGTLLDLAGPRNAADYSFSQLGTIVNAGGAVRVDGLLTLGGETMHVTAGGSYDGLQLAGIISGGTVSFEGVNVAFDDGALGNSTVTGGLDLSADNSILSVTGGLTLSCTVSRPLRLRSTSKIRSIRRTASMAIGALASSASRGSGVR